MFDWNEEELANIIWGEAGSSDDHIVPYPEVTAADLGNKKEWNQEATSIKLTEQKRPGVKIDVHCRKLGSTSKLDDSGGLSASGYGTNSWPDLSLFSAARTDQGSLGTEVSKTFSEIRTFNSSRSEVTTQLGKDVEVFQRANEGKEQGDFGDYGWGNIGSFDDLERIFSNDDSIFSNISLDNAGELWSSKDVSNSTTPISLDTPSTAAALRNRSEPLEIKADYVHCNDQLFALSYNKSGGSACHDTQNVHTITTDVTYSGERSKSAGKEHQDIVGRITSSISGVNNNVANANELADKACGQNNLLKVQKQSQGKQEARRWQNFYGSWSPTANLSEQFENQMTPSVIQSSPPSVLGKQKQIQGAEAFYQNIMNPYQLSPVYGNPANTYPSIPMLPQAQSELRHQHLLSGYEMSGNLVNPVKKSRASVKPMTMTPQEKIEKLRRRQQMQAMLAIQKQQKQLGNQAPSINKFIGQTYLLEMQNHSSDGTDPEIEDQSTFPAFDPPIEQDDSNTVSGAIDDCFVEETILYKLQDIISKLDIKVRLCIRDSLFRLAQSAMERNPASDSSSTNKNSREEINWQNRYARMPRGETETNPIDRTVAHFLFHRPLESNGNYADKLNSPISARTQNKSLAVNLPNLTVKCLPDENMKTNKQFSDQGLRKSCSLIEAHSRSMDQFRNIPCIEISKNASNNGSADVGAQELETSR